MFLPRIKTALAAPATPSGAGATKAPRRGRPSGHRCGRKHPGIPERRRRRRHRRPAQRPGHHHRRRRRRPGRRRQRRGRRRQRRVGRTGCAEMRNCLQRLRSGWGRWRRARAGRRSGPPEPVVGSVRLVLVGRWRRWRRQRRRRSGRQPVRGPRRRHRRQRRWCRLVDDRHAGYPRHDRDRHSGSEPGRNGDAHVRPAAHLPAHAIGVLGDRRGNRHGPADGNDVRRPELPTGRVGLHLEHEDHAHPGRHRYCARQGRRRSDHDVPGRCTHRHRLPQRHGRCERPGQRDRGRDQVGGRVGRPGGGDRGPFGRIPGHLVRRLWQPDRT